MSEEQKENTPKTQEKYYLLPELTEIAVLCIFICGIGLIIYSIICAIVTSIGPDAPGWGLYFLLVSVPYIFPGIYLLKRSIPNWRAAVLLMSLYLLGEVIYIVWHLQYHQFFSFVLALCIITAIPLILTLLDGKNYFRMVRQRNREKEDEEKGDS